MNNLGSSHIYSHIFSHIFSNSYSFPSHYFANYIFTGGMTLIISMFFSFVKNTEYINQKYVSTTNLIIKQNEQITAMFDRITYRITVLEKQIEELQIDLEKSKKKLFVNSTILETVKEEQDLEQELEIEEKDLQQENKELIVEPKININDLIDDCVYKGIVENNSEPIVEETNYDLEFEFVDNLSRHNTNRSKRTNKWYHYFY